MNRCRSNFWIDVEGYEGVYQVSKDGQIRTHKNNAAFSKLHGVRRWKQRVLKQKADKGGYKRVCLYKDGKPKDYLVHRLVATAFCRRYGDRDIVNHIDGNPSNNHFSNLEWCNPKENNNHAFDTGLMTTNKVISLLDKKTGEIKRFRSMQKASCFLGKSHGYISEKLKRGKKDIGNFEIVD
jgi:hypothetical protein